MTLGVDRPLAIGDTVKIDDFTATVEQIGLRSTRLRTVDQTIITIPNGRLADMRIENISQRSCIRFATNLALAHSTESVKIRAIITAIRGFFEAHPKVEKETVSVAFIALGESSLTIEVVAFYESTEWVPYRDFRQDVLLTLMEIVEKEGAEFASPVRNVRMLPHPPVPSP